jgi:hypothetical protein
VAGDALRAKLKKIFTEEHHQKQLDELDDNGLLEWARTVREGVHFATPVFDGRQGDGHQGGAVDGRPASQRAVDPVRLAAPVSRSTTTSPSASCTC